MGSDAGFFESRHFLLRVLCRHADIDRLGRSRMLIEQPRYHIRRDVVLLEAGAEADRISKNTSRCIPGTRE